MTTYHWIIKESKLPWLQLDITFPYIKMLAEAVDLQHFKRGKMDNLMIFQNIIDGALEFDQMILEFGDSTSTSDPLFPAWIHVSWKIKDNRRQILVAYKDENNKTKYRPKLNYHSV